MQRRIGTILSLNGEKVRKYWTKWGFEWKNNEFVGINQHERCMNYKM